MSTIFRPYNPSTGQRSDRSAGDRLRHRQKVREAIRNNIADIIAEESIIGKDRNRIIKVPIRGVKEYRFIYGENAPGVGQGGDGEPKPGDVVGQGEEGKAGQQAGDRPGVDYYEARIFNSPQITPETLAAMGPLLTDTVNLILPGSKLDVVAFGCTSASMVRPR